MEINRLSVLAYSDRSEQPARIAWRGFLSFFLANLLQLDSEETDLVVGACVAREVEDLESADASSVQHAVRTTSVGLALVMGLPAEFGAASMMECNPPTRVHAPLGQKLKPPTQDQLLMAWVGQLDLLQDDQEFLVVATEWRDLIEAALIREETKNIGDIEDIEDTEESKDDDEPKNVSETG